MRSKRFVGVILPLIALSFCSGPQRAPRIRFPYLWLDVQGFGGDIDRQHLTEPSGISYHRQRDTLFVVSDEGEIAEIRRDGTPVANTKVRGDLESVAVVPETGLVYIGIEGDDVILEFDPVKGEVTRRFPINRSFDGDPDLLKKKTDDYDNGIESMAFVPDPAHPEGGTFYVGNQWDPPMIMEVLCPLKSSRAEEAEARIIRVLPFRMDDPAAMYYDPVTKLLNVVSDADNILVEITLEGRLVNEYAFPGDNQEGVCRDDEGYLYIAQDSGGILKVKDLRRR
ncbi:MAG: SdiA-regulated domain-containing protein [Candidatus Aminicenantes bacterium]|nr:SdiA-regulated domain-containing protein [Candidatus Aminicenantes bacterium]